MISTLFGLNKYLLGGAGLAMLVLLSAITVQTNRLSNAHAEIAELEQTIESNRQTAALNQFSAEQRCGAISARKSYENATDNRTYTNFASSWLQQFSSTTTSTAGSQAMSAPTGFVSYSSGGR